MPTVCFRGDCLTGPAHAGAKLHGLLSYLMKCRVAGDPYTILGYGGKQVRDNIHSAADDPGADYKLRQVEFFEDEGAEFEITRPRGQPRLYGLAAVREVSP
jgi:hypothetical protein